MGRPVAAISSCLRWIRRDLVRDSLAAIVAMIRTISPSPLKVDCAAGDESHVADASGVQDFHELFQLDRPSSQPIVVVDDHPVPQAVA